MNVKRLVMLVTVGALALTVTTGCQRLLDLLSPEESGSNLDPPEPPAVKVRSAWYAEHPGYAYVEPALWNDLVYVGTGNGYVLAREQASGRGRWGTRVGNGMLVAFNIVARAGVVVAPVDTQTVGLDAATGAVLWRYKAPPETGEGANPGPGYLQAVRVDADDEAAYIPAWGGSIAVVELRTGRVRWTWLPPSGFTYAFFGDGARVDQGVVYANVTRFLNTGGTKTEAWVVALDARTGRELWRTVLPKLGSGLTDAGAPSVAGSRVIAMLTSGDVFGLDRQTGAILWHVPQEMPVAGESTVAVFAGPAVAGDTIYADIGLDRIRALRASDGKELWRAGYPAQIKNNMLVTEHYIYGPAEDIYVFERHTGKMIGRIRQPNQKPGAQLFPATPAGGPNGRVFAAANGAT